jgi:AcrR family transcriptional regulator
MPRTEEASQQIRETQRGKILEAARRVFARKGLSATVDDVAVEAAVSHGLAYRYFASKQALFQELVSQDLQSPAAGLQVLLDLPGTPDQRLARIITGFVESRREHPQHYLILDQALNDEATPRNLRELIRERGQAVQAAMRTLIIEGQAAGEIAPGDPDQLVRAILACLDGLTHWAALHQEQYQQHFPDAEIFLRMIKP